MRIQSSKEKRKLTEKLEAEYETHLDFTGLEILYGDHEYFIVTRECLEQNLEGLTIDSLGLRLTVETQPTINAIQLFYKKTKKTINLSEQEIQQFLKKQEISINKPDGNYIICSNNKPVDSGTVKQNKLLRRN